MSSLHPVDDTTNSGSINFNVQSGATVTTNSLALGTDKGLNSTINFATGKTFTFSQNSIGQFSQNNMAMNGDLNINTGARLITKNLQLNGNLKNELTGYDLTILGDYTMGENATLTLSLTAVDQIDGLRISGDASLDGHLELFDAAIYNAQVGDQLELITALHITGEFDSISLPSLPDILGLKLIYESNRVIAEVVAKPEVIFNDGFENVGGAE